MLLSRNRWGEAEATSVEVSCPQRTCKHDPPLAVTLRYVLEADLAAGRRDAAADPPDFLKGRGRVFV